MNNKRGRPKKYVFWSDWETWLLKEWLPFKTNDLPHLLKDVSLLKRDAFWLKGLMIGIILCIIGGAIAVIVTG